MNPAATVDHGRLLEVLGIEGELLASAALGAPGGELIPGCPGLTIAETVRHVGAEYRAARRWIEHGSRPRGPDALTRRPAGRRPTPAEPRSRAGASTAETELVDEVQVDEVQVDELRWELREVRAELAARPPAAPCATWWPADQTCGFFRRRLAHETTVHRVDVQAAAGRPVDPIAPDLAIDGIDEVLRLWFGYRLGELGIAGTYRAAVAVHAGGHEWIARAGPGGAEVVAGAPVDAVVSGSPAGIYLWLWGRLPDRVVVVDGDHDAAAQLWALLRLATR